MENRNNEATTHYDHIMKQGVINWYNFKCRLDVFNEINDGLDEIKGLEKHFAGVFDLERAKSMKEKHEELKNYMVSEGLIDG